MIMRTSTFLLIALTSAAAGCSGKSNRSDGGGSVPPPPPPQAASYSASVTAVAIVNKDTGEQLVVGGLPAQGGELNVP